MQALAPDLITLIPALVLGPYWVPYVPVVAVFGFSFMVFL